MNARATKFGLLLLHDVAWFLFLFASFFVVKSRIVAIIGWVFLIFAEWAGGRAQRVIAPLTLLQIRIRAIFTVIRYLAFSGLFVWADFTLFRDPAAKAPPGVLSLLLIPVLLVICYVHVRRQLGLEHDSSGSDRGTPNQAMQLTPSRTESTFPND